MIYLGLEDLLRLARRVLPVVQIKDSGLLESALGRPQASVFGADAYPGLLTKAAAVTHSVTKNHALIDGNKRLGLASLIAFLGVNGQRLTMTNGEAYDFVIAIAEGRLDSVIEMAEILERSTAPRL